jgi:branched-chain amino acid transport system permease protein
MSNFTALFASGLAEGAIAALAAVGFLLTYKATGVVNFAQGALITFAAYIAIWITQGGGMFGWGAMGLIPGYILTIALMFGVGVILERVAYAPLRGRSIHVVVIATLGASIVLIAFIGLWQGSTPKYLGSPVSPTELGVDASLIHVFGAVIEWQRALIVIFTAIIVVALIVLFQRTQFGRQLRATATDRNTARLCGVPVNMLSMLAFGMSAALAGLAGVLFAPLGAVDLNFGFQVMLLGFAAAVLGGFGSIGGVVAGGIAIGLTEQLLGGYVFSDYKHIFPFVLMLVVIAVRPQGLFGRATARRL